MSVLKLVVTHETSLLVQKSCGSVTWYESVNWFFGQMRGLLSNLGSLSSNLDTLYSNLSSLSSNPRRGKNEPSNFR
jgi:hypothetical protein